MSSRLRKQVQPAFTKGALESWRSIIDELAAEPVDDMIAAGDCDAVLRLTIPMPLGVIAAILAVPDGNIADFRRWLPAVQAACPAKRRINCA